MSKPPVQVQVQYYFPNALESVLGLLILWFMFLLPVCVTDMYCASRHQRFWQKFTLCALGFIERITPSLSGFRIPAGFHHQVRAKCLFQEDTGNQSRSKNTDCLFSGRKTAGREKYLGNSCSFRIKVMLQRAVCLPELPSVWAWFFFFFFYYWYPFL